jgi:hypothetical protein
MRKYVLKYKKKKTRAYVSSFVDSIPALPTLTGNQPASDKIYNYSNSDMDTDNLHYNVTTNNAYLKKSLLYNLQVFDYLRKHSPVESTNIEQENHYDNYSNFDFLPAYAKFQFNN